ncbi:hypothetical protein SLA2020_051450 [Shorea laevis]
MLKSFLDYEGGPKAKRFRSNIWKCNCQFAFTSFGAKIDDTVNTRHGPFCFKLCGQCCHRIGSLLPPEGQNPTFAQLYVFDTDNEVQNRLNVANTSTDDDPLNKEIVEDLIKMFDECNKLVQVFRRARNALAENGIPEFQLKLLSGGGPGDHQYFAPEMAETIGLIIGAKEEIVQGRDVIIQHRNGTVKRINSSFPYYMALQYPILFPYGEEGYRNNLYEIDENGNQTNDRISICDYYRYYFQLRVNEWNTITYGSRLS